MLQHVADLRRIFSQRLAVQEDLAGFRLHEPCDQREKRGFADGIVVETNSAILTKSSNVFEGMFTEDTILEKSIALRIRYHMQRKKISQPKLAKAVGCSRDTIYRYENGIVPEGNMSIEILKKIADYFEVDQYYFCNDYHVFIDTTDDIPLLLKRTRKELGMTQRQFVAKYNIPLESYKKYETGDTVIAQKYWKNIISVITHMAE